MTPKSIVVPLDGSQLVERAVHVAAPLAERLGASVELVTTRWLNDTRSPRDYLDSVAGFTAMEGEVVEACNWAEALGREVTIVHVSHPLDPQDCVSAQRMLASLRDVMATRGHIVKTHTITSTLARVALGSVTMGVLNAATCPVLVLPPGAD